MGVLEHSKGFRGGATASHKTDRKTALRAMARVLARSVGYLGV